MATSRDYFDRLADNPVATRIAASGAHWETIEACGGGWIVLRDGFQMFGPIDHSIGCGTRVFETYSEAANAMHREAAEDMPNA